MSFLEMTVYVGNPKKSPKTKANKWVQQVHRIQDKHTKESIVFLYEHGDTKI